MASLNKVMIIGNLGKDPELRHTGGGTAVVEFSVAVNGRRKAANGEWEDVTEWFSVKIWDKQAERAAEWLRKGSSVYVEGRMETRSWDDKDGGAKHYKTELIASTFMPLDRRENNGGERPANTSAPTTSAPVASGEDDDLPF